MERFKHKKGPEVIRALVFGGGGGNRTRVRKHSAFGTTCLVTYVLFNPTPAKETVRGADDPLKI